MLKLKYFLLSLPFLITLAFWQKIKFMAPNPASQKVKITSQVVGKWIVGPHKNFKDADTLELQVAIDNALSDGSTPHIADGISDAKVPANAFGQEPHNR